MRRLLALCGVTIAACAPPAAPTRAAAPDLALSAAVDPIVDAAYADGFAGGVAITRDGAIIYQRLAGSADLDGKIPVADATLFHVASLTKYFAAALTLKAVEEGRLSLNDAVAPMFPGLDIVAPQVTILDLLAHRSGLGSSYAAEGATDPETAAAAIDAVAYDPVRAGTFRYSNDGYDLLAIILERLYARPYEQLVSEKLVLPAGLVHVGFWGDVDLDDPSITAQTLEPLGEALSRAQLPHVGFGGIADHGLGSYGMGRRAEPRAHPVASLACGTARAARAYVARRGGVWELPHRSSGARPRPQRARGRGLGR